MPKIEKSACFRSVSATGVYALPTEKELRLLFVGQEPVGIEMGDAEHQTLITQGPHIQAEIILNRELAQWIQKYLNEYLKPAEVKPTEAAKQ